MSNLKTNADRKIEKIDKDNEYKNIDIHKVDRLNKFKDFLFSFFKFIIILLIGLALAFIVFKIFKWDSIFGKKSIANITETHKFDIPESVDINNISNIQKTNLENFINKIKVFDLNIKTFKVISQSDISIILSGSNLREIIIDSDQNSNITWNNFSSVYDNPKFKKILSEGKVIDYIDLRYGSKIYFKTENQESSSSTKSISASST